MRFVKSMLSIKIEVFLKNPVTIIVKLKCLTFWLYVPSIYYSEVSVVTRFGLTLAYFGVRSYPCYLWNNMMGESFRLPPYTDTTTETSIHIKLAIDDRGRIFNTVGNKHGVSSPSQKDPIINFGRTLLHLRLNLPRGFYWITLFPPESMFGQKPKIQVKRRVRLRRLRHSSKSPCKKIRTVK